MLLESVKGKKRNLINTIVVFFIVLHKDWSNNNSLVNERDKQTCGAKPSEINKLYETSQHHLEILKRHAVMRKVATVVRNFYSQLEAAHRGVC